MIGIIRFTFAASSTVGRVGREDTVSERPEPVAFRFVANHRRPHRNATECDLGVGPKIVKPRRMFRVSGLRGDDRDPVLVVEVDNRVPSHRAALRAAGFEQGRGQDEAHSETAPGCPQQIWIELPNDVDRDQPSQAAAGKRGIGAAEPAARAVGVDVLELSRHRGILPRDSFDPCVSVSPVARLNAR